MWIVSQDKTRVCKAIRIWIVEGKKVSQIKILNKAASIDFSSEIVGEYEKERAKEVFELLLSDIGEVEKFYMPKY